MVRFSNTFPAAAVETALRNELLQYVVSIAAAKGIDLPPAVEAQATFSVQIDSLGVVELLCAVEPLLGFELKDSVVRTGGYTSVEQAIAHLMPRIQKAWLKNKGYK